jgi:WD40 repeat protein
VTCVEFSPDGGRIVSCGAAGAGDGGGGDSLHQNKTGSPIAIWDAASGRLIRAIDDSAGLVRRARFSGDGSRLVTCSGDDNLRIYDTISGRLVGRLRATLRTIELGGERITDSGFADCAISPDGRLAVAAGGEGVLLWPIEDAPGAEPYLLPMAESPLRLVFTPDSSRVIAETRGAKDRLYVWHVASRELLDVFERADDLGSVLLSGDGSRLGIDSRTGFRSFLTTGEGGGAPSPVVRR